MKQKQINCTTCVSYNLLYVTCDPYRSCLRSTCMKQTISLNIIADFKAEHINKNYKHMNKYISYIEF